MCALLQNLYEEIQTYDGRVTAMLESGQTLIGKCSPSTSASLVRSLDNLATRWQSVKTRADERKLKLEEALRQADSFHESLNSSIVWLTNTEKTLNNVKPVSRVVDSCLAQIEQHKVGMAQIEQHEVGMAKVEQHEVGMAKALMCIHFVVPILFCVQIYIAKQSVYVKKIYFVCILSRFLRILCHVLQ